MPPSPPPLRLAIVGAARSGTSLLAAQLATHPQIDASAVKEPNYFSRHYDRGPDWYEGFFRPPSDDVVRLDASVSYTFPQFPEALGRLAESSPSVTVVYVVRDPIPRAVSHFQYYRHYFGHEKAPSFGAALRRDAYYTDVSDYRRWLAAMSEVLPPEQILVVPFSAVTRSSGAVADVVYARLGLAAPQIAGEEAAGIHQNNVVAFRSEAVRRATRMLRHSRAYPVVRRALGAGNLRRIRSAVTKVPDVESFDEALASCDDEQRAALEVLRVDATAAVAEWLATQDDGLRLDWAADWPSAARAG